MTDNPLEGRRVVRSIPIREQVAALLRDAIADLRLQPGQVLVERRLVEMTSASRPSVREALRQLETEGLVQSRNGRGTVVATPGPETARDVYAVRAELEGLAAALFAEHATDDQVAQLDRAASGVEAAVAAGDAGRALLAVKAAFYEVLFTGAGNPVLHEMAGTLRRRVTQLRALTLARPGRPAASGAEIREIADAIARRDPAAARQAAARHVEEAARIVPELLSESQD